MSDTITINGVTYSISQVQHALECHTTAIGALEQCKRMIDEALPKFDWGASFLDADAIRLLNEAPIAVNIALKKMKRDSDISHQSD